MKHGILAILLVIGAGPAAAAESNIYTDGTCIKMGIPGQSASKSGCDSIGGVWRSRRSAEAIGAAGQRGNAAKQEAPAKPGRMDPNATEGEAPAPR